MSFDGGVEFGSETVGGEGRASEGWEKRWQHYPSSEALADMAWSKFKSGRVERLLDACAGSGALADAYVRRISHRARGELGIDAVEIDARCHPMLRSKGFNIVGFDFLAMDASAGAIYSHIILNPPFNAGAKHVLKAWDLLWEGEVVAILNAETIKNPYTNERRHLVRLIEEFGSVSYVEDAFKGDGVEREANVEIAIVHLVKAADCNRDWIGPVIDGLKVDEGEDPDFKVPNELALPSSFVKNQVIAFEQAVKAMREGVRMSAVASHFRVRVGYTLAQLNGDEGLLKDAKVEGASIREELRAGYLDLKDRAWTSILRSTEALSRLSEKVQKQAESQFNEIKHLEFTESNVYGFLLGLVESQPEMQIDMACDVFDQVSKYHADNKVYYKGWKSNSKHRTAGMRLKTTRFILPNNGSYGTSLDWSAERRLADIDKVFRMLDGKVRMPGSQAPDLGLVATFRANWDALLSGERVSSEYFDVRFYKGIGTIHFFPRSKELMDALNRMVGKRRKWLPPNLDESNKTFWKAYESAEKFDKEVREEFAALRKSEGVYAGRWNNPFNELDREGGDGGAATDLMDKALGNVLRKHKLLDALEQEQGQAEGRISQSDGGMGGVQLLLTSD